MAEWTRDFINRLPDSSFLYIEAGGKKDLGGKTTPRSLRHFPYKDQAGQVDLAQIQSAIAQALKSHLPPSVKRRVQRRAREILEKAKRRSSLKGYALVFAGEVAKSAGEHGPAEDGTPRGRYVKDLIRTGRFIHPSEGWVLNVTKDQLRTWLENFRLMRRRGIDVELTTTHQDPGDRAESIVGYMVEASIEGNQLMGTFEVSGQKGIDIVRTVRNVSVEILPEWTDGKGNTYVDVITAVAIVEKPIVPGQEPFRIAASHGDATDLPAFIASTGSTPMEELLKLIADLTGKDVTEENALEVMKAFANDFAKTETKISTLQSKVEELEMKAASSGPPEVDDDVMEDLAESRSSELEALVKAGHLTPKCRDKLKAAMIGEPGKRRHFALSTKHAKVYGLPVPFARMVIDALKFNDPVKLSEQTKRQVVPLERYTPDDETGDGHLDKDLGSRAAAVYGGPPVKKAS